MFYKYIVLASFTANIDGNNRNFQQGDEIILPTRHLELDSYINQRDLYQDNYKKSGHIPYGMVAIEEVKDDKLSQKNSIKTQTK